MSTLTPRRKLALVIGNNDYQRPESKLRHCINDANDLTDTLTSIGFLVHKNINLTNQQMVDAIADFSHRIIDGDLVLFYFSGHGYQVEHANYLMPIDDEKIITEDDVKDRAVPVERTLNRLAKRNPSYVTLFILDCCRAYWPKNMKIKDGVNGKGLSFVNAPAGTFIQFACGASKTASDGLETDRNGLFTKHLLKHIITPNEDIVQIFQGVAGDVYEESSGRQIPLSINGLLKKGHVHLSDLSETKPNQLHTSKFEKTDSLDTKLEKTMLIHSTSSSNITAEKVNTLPKSASLGQMSTREASNELHSSDCCANNELNMLLIGRLASRVYLITMIKSVEEIENGNKSGFNKLENLLEYLTINKIDGKEFPVEDRFNATLLELMNGKEKTYEAMKQICRHYEAVGDVNIDEIMKEHEQRIESSAHYFTRKDLPDDGNQAAALALSFYTGSKGQVINQGAKLIANHPGNRDTDKADDEKMNDLAPLVFHFFKAILHIPYYWGTVTSNYQLTDDQLQLCQPGCVVTWVQFGQGGRNASAVTRKKNTKFMIDSFTGRSIKKFSQTPNEDEIVFLPYSTFFVYKHESSRFDDEHTIYMRQVELGLSQYSILWVDDKIFTNNSEIKLLMENAVRGGFNLDVHFIPRTSTDDALAFLRSPFGQRLKKQNTFRIITCMNRRQENPGHNAGVRLIKSIRELGFENHCLVFTGDKKRAETYVQTELNANEQKCVFVTHHIDDLRNFTSFQIFS
ncbi:unnamed protein product [Adineta ricciae]|uniref:Caspase family p20 domain-containing protein n=3 Tax=Adineta ricciae TaxID=249248 RepID=A0A815F4W8_ADIRI|nr:unnamed protein product [Adineta ricciae]